MKTLLILLILFPVSALAEGARMVVACTVAQVCDAAGICSEGSGDVTFVLAPNAVTASGEESYVVSRDNITSAATGQSRTGPFSWTESDGMTQTLFLTAETTALLVSQNPTQPLPDTRVQFLTCEVTL